GYDRVFDEAAGKVVQELAPPIGTPDFGPYTGKIRRDVGVVATLVPGADGIRFIKQYEEFGLKGKIPVVDTAPGITDIAVLPAAGTPPPRIPPSPPPHPPTPTPPHPNILP